MTPLRVPDWTADTADVAALDFGFCSEHRLHTAEDFSLVFAARKVVRGEKFDLHYRSRESVAPGPGARLGLVIAKKLARRAVQRNLLKRLAREVFRHVRQRLPPYDLVLRLSKPAGASMDQAARKLLRRDLEQLLCRLPA